MEEATIKSLSKTDGDFMSDQIVSQKEELPAGNPTEAAAKAEAGSAACPMQRKGWFNGPLAMAICCGAPLFLIAAVAFFGLSWGALASGALSLVALLACPVGMFLMMRIRWCSSIFGLPGAFLAAPKPSRLKVLGKAIKTAAWSLLASTSRTRRRTRAFMKEFDITYPNG